MNFILSPLRAVRPEYCPLEKCWRLAHDIDASLLPRRALLPRQRWATKKAARKAARKVNTRQTNV